jgi:hypothetical protein
MPLRGHPEQRLFDCLRQPVAVQRDCGGQSDFPGPVPSALGTNAERDFFFAGREDFCRAAGPKVFDELANPAAAEFGKANHEKRCIESPIENLIPGPHHGRHQCRWFARQASRWIVRYG